MTACEFDLTRVDIYPNNTFTLATRSDKYVVLNFETTEKAKLSLRSRNFDANIAIFDFIHTYNCYHGSIFPNPLRNS